MKSMGLGIGVYSALWPLHVTDSLCVKTTTGAKRFINTSHGISSTNEDIYVIAHLNGSIWCSVGTLYGSSDARIKKNILDVNDDTALDKILNIQPKTYEYKDVINRGTNRVYGFISQQIAEPIPEAVSSQKGTLFDIYIVFLNVMEILFI